uniref:Uncharacterized protein n=1 Tax=Lepeophtheirus salmonis TaxID=72036 RepID=A0A0K2TCD9_LEPSM
MIVFKAHWSYLSAFQFAQDEEVNSHIGIYFIMKMKVPIYYISMNLQYLRNRL